MNKFNLTGFSCFVSLGRICQLQSRHVFTFKTVRVSTLELIWCYYSQHTYLPQYIFFPNVFFRLVWRYSKTRAGTTVWCREFTDVLSQ